VETDTPQPPDANTSPSPTDVIEWVRQRWPHACTVESRALKLAEEAGEVVGAVVKMSEGRKTLADLATECAQAVMCLKGIAGAAGFDLDAAVTAEWVDMQTRTWPS
jgi:NTP pyrophosphatase (non-canonical NTP hydrolase)